MKYKIILLSFILLFQISKIHCSDLIWTQKTSMPTPRAGLGVGVVNDKIYAIGGYNSGSLNTVEEYDPVSDTWTVKASMLTARDSFYVGVVNNKIYAIGGLGGISRVILNTVEEYDPVADTWTVKTSMPTGRCSFAIGVVNNKIYVIGGDLTGSNNYISTVEEYDPLSDTWTVKASMLTARNFLAASSLGGKIYALGGLGTDGILPTVEEYDPLTNSWTVKADMNIQREYSCAGVIDNKLYAIGGMIAFVIDDVEEYNPLTNTWTTSTSMPSALDGFGLGEHNSNLYVIGGQGFGGLKNTVYEATIDIANYVLDHYEVSVPTFSISAGSDFSMTVTAKNDTGDTLTSYSGSVNLQSVLASNETMAGSGVLGVASVDLTNGVATINTQTYNRGEAIKIKVTDSNQKSGISNQIEFIPTYGLAISLSANPSSVLSGEPTQITAEIKDYYGSLLKNADVTFTVIRGSGSLSAVSGTTDDNGRIVVTFTPLSSGNCEIRAASALVGLTPVSVTINTLTLILSSNGGIVVSNDGISSVEILPNTFPWNVVIAITKVSDVSSGQGQEFEIVGEEESSRQKITDVNKTIKLVLHYELDTDNNVANTNVKSAEVNDKLALFYWDGVDWQKVGFAVDSTAQTVTANVTHFSKYALRPTVKPSSFSYKRVSPRPFTPKSIGVYDRAYFYYENPENLGVDIKIFTLKGSLVRDINTSSGATPYWDGKDNNGKLMPGGVYIFQMKAGGKVIKDTIILAK